MALSAITSGITSAITSEFSGPLVSVPPTPGMIDASTGEMSVALAKAEVAVARARAAQPLWAARAVAERARIVERFRRLAYARRAEIAALVTSECGKPLPESYVADVSMALEGARFLTRIAVRTLAPRRTRSQVLAAWRKSITTHYEPHGVVAVISPWNYPFLYPAMHVLPALLAGNTVVLKASEYTPQCGALLVSLLHEAGVPADALIALEGDGRTGAALVSANIDKVLFTGSERTGRAIAIACAPRFVPVSLELGGSDAAVVLEDAPMEHTASGILWGRFANAGQTCVAVKRVIAIGSAYDALLPRLATAMRSLVIAAPTPTAHGSGAIVDLGPLVSATQRDLIAAQLDDAIARGATVYARVEPETSSTLDASEHARMAPAVILTDVTREMRVWHEETFGPVLVVVRAQSEAEAVSMANDTRYGLSASVWTRNRDAAQRIAARLEAGAVVINDSVLNAGLPEVAHGGVKASGLGRRHGVEGLMECVRTRTVLDDAFIAMRQPWWFGYGSDSATRLDAYLRLTHGTSLGDRLSGIAGTLKMLLRPERPL
jgi:acyl-CoA reductase-like NAD-dependent aldehyde dehydrogenase